MSEDARQLAIPSTKSVLSLLERNSISVVVVCSPPLCYHVAGKLYKKPETYGHDLFSESPEFKFLGVHVILGSSNFAGPTLVHVDRKYITVSSMNGVFNVEDI